MGDLATLIGAIALLLLSLCVVAIILLIVFNPEPLHQFIRLVKRISYGKAEIELAHSKQPAFEHGSEKNARLEATDETDAKDKSGTSEQLEEAAPDKEKPDFGTRLNEVDAHFKIGNYEKGMDVARELIHDEDEKFSDEAGWIALFRLTALKNHGLEEAFDDLQKDHKHHPDNPHVTSRLVSALHYVGQTSEAITLGVENLKSLRDQAAIETGRSILAVEIAEIYQSIGNNDEAVELLKDELSLAEAPDTKSRLLKALGSVYENMPSPMYEKALSLYELSLSHAPFSNELRFDVAYLYGERGQSDMALFHYKKLLNRDPEHTTAANNAGVASVKLGLPATGVTWYKRAWGQGGTIAASNLAYKFINEGFLDEAKELLEEAQNEDDPDERVYEALGRLGEIHSEEKRKGDSLSEKAKTMQKWNRRYAEKILLPAESECISGKYEGEPYTIELKVEGSRVKGKVSLSDKETFYLNGNLSGEGISFSWRIARTGLFSDDSKGQGILILEEGLLRGYSRESSSEPEEELTLWNLRKSNACTEEN